MTDKEVRLLVKLLSLTMSDNDFEALTAIRKANELLKRYNLSWKDMYQPQPQITYTYSTTGWYG